MLESVQRKSDAANVLRVGQATAGLCAGGGELGRGFDELAGVACCGWCAERCGFAGFDQAAALHHGPMRVLR